MAIDVLLNINSAADLAGVQAGIQMLSKFGKVVLDQLSKLEKWNQLTSRASINVLEVDSNLKGIVDTFSLFKQANELQQAGLKVTEEQFEGLGKLAINYAKATGTDATAAMEKLTSSLSRGSTRALRPFGIDLKEGGTQAENFANGMAQVEEKSKDLTVEIETMDEALFAVKNSMETAAGVAYDGAVEGGGFSVFKDILVGTNTILGDIVDSMNNLNKYMPELNNPLTILSISFLKLKASVLGFLASLGLVKEETAAGAQSAYLGELGKFAKAGAIRQHNDMTGRSFSSREDARLGYKRTSGGGGGGGRRGGRGGGNSGGIDMSFTMDEVDALNKTSQDELLMSDADMRFAKAGEGMFMANMLGKPVDEEQIELSREYTDLLTVQLDVMLEAQSQNLTFASQFKEAWSDSFETISMGAYAANTATAFLREGWEAAVTSVITGEESIGKALQRIIKDIAKSVAVEAGFQALVETARAIGALASQQYDKAAEHAAAAVAWGVAGVAAGGIAAVGFNSAVGGHARNSHSQGAGGFSGTRGGTRSFATGSSASGNDKVNVTINLEGDAAGIFKVVQVQNAREQNAGRESFRESA